MDTKNEKANKKLKGKRQISVITIMMFIFLLFVTSTITMNALKDKLFYEDTELVTVKIGIMGGDTSDSEFDEGVKNLNIYARNQYTKEELTQLTFVEKDGDYYVFQSRDKTYGELENCKIYIEIQDIGNYEASRGYYASRSFNLNTNKWEYDYSLGDTVYLYFNTKPQTTKTIQILVGAYNLPNKKVPEELYKNIILVDNNDRPFIFDSVNSGGYHLYNYIGDASATSIKYVYVPNIVEKNIDTSLISILENYDTFVTDLGEFRRFETDMKDSHMYILYEKAETSIQRELTWKSNSNTDATLKFVYQSRNRENNINEIMAPYSSYNGEYFTFLIYEEKLPDNFEVPSEYETNSEWTFLDEAPDKVPEFSYYWEKLDINGDELKVPESVIDCFLNRNLYNGSTISVQYTGKKYVYVKSTNTVYTIVNELNAGNYYARNVINIRYTGDTSSKEYLTDESGVHAWHVCIDWGGTTCSTDWDLLVKELNVKYCNVAVEKKWEDEDNKYGKRLDSVTVNLKANGEINKTVSLHRWIEWKYVFECLPVVDSSGNEIKYTIEEVTTNAFYKSDITSTVNANKESFVITNSITVPDEEIEITGKIVWEDENNKYGMRPSSIKLQLKNEAGEVVETGEVNEENDWSYKFSAPKYNEDLTEAKYTIDEEDTGSIYYEKAESSDSSTVVNKFVVPDEKVNKTLIKKWEDEDNKYEKRPDSITFELYANDELIDTYVLSDTTKSGEIYVFENLDKYNEFGEIEYKIVEKRPQTDGVVWYDTQIVYENDTFEVTNIFRVPNEKVSKTVTKIWDDESNKNGRRSDSVTFELYANDELIDTYTLTDTTKDKVTYTFEDLDKYNEFGEIKYRIAEKQDGNEFYISNQVGDEIINKFVLPEDKIKITGTKVWEDNDNIASKREKGVTLELKADGEIVAEGYVSEENNWTYEFEVLKYNENAEEIVYELDEKEENNIFYERIEVENDDMLNQKIVNKFVVPSTKIVIKAEMIWIDENNKYEMRPSKVVLQVKANGKVVKSATVNEETNWQHEFELAKYDELGNEIEYTVDEKKPIKYYEKNIDKYTITNTCIYNAAVDTSDINIYIYIGVVVVAVIGIVGIISFQIKKARK